MALIQINGILYIFTSIFVYLQARDEAFIPSETFYPCRAENTKLLIDIVMNIWQSTELIHKSRLGYSDISTALLL